MAELQSLLKKRATIKGHLTRFINFVDTLSDVTTRNSEKFVQLSIRIASAESLLNQFNDVQELIENLQTEVTEIENNNKERDNFENSYFTYIQLGKNLEVPAKQVNCNPSNLGWSNNLFNLPKIDLKTYNGDYQNWLEYKSMFISMVHSNPVISNMHKYHYLRASLKDDAYKVIQSVNFSEDHYHIAWQTLLERYDDTWLLICNHVKGIFELPVLTKESHSMLRKLHEDFSRHLHSLKVLNLPIQYWDILLIYIISKKLDPVSKREWEGYAYENELPSVSDLKTFLKNKCKLLEKMTETSSVASNDKGKHERVKTYVNNTTVNNNELSCAYCKDKHSIRMCDKFKALSTDRKISEIKILKLCFNCLKGWHSNKQCKAPGCKICHKKHHYLLHLQNDEPVRALNTETIQSTSQIQSATAPQYTSLTATNQNFNCCSKQILLSTATVKIVSKSGNYRYCRALLDSGSQSNFLTEDICNELGLDKIKIDLCVTGINQMATTISEKVDILLKSKNETFVTDVSCIVVPSITGNIPNQTFNATDIKIPSNISLADKLFNVSGKVDILIGAQIFWNLLCVGQIRLGSNLPTLQKTRLGWVLSGPLDMCISQKSVTQCNLLTNTDNVDIQKQLAKFWEIEECTLNNGNISLEEKFCEDNFKETTTRSRDGRFIVTIPLKNSIELLGNSRNLAIKRFHALEKKFETNNDLKKQYVAFIREYQALGHMSELTDNKDSNVNFYLPHHGILKDSVTTKLRVVFDGSAKSDTGYSINDLQLVGPVIQNDLFEILIRFREHAYILSADVEKMYRQVLIAPEQRNLQRIVWRENTSEPLKTFVLNTVTYGTSSASFLAIRALHELGHKFSTRYPKAASVILRDFYVDDLLTGCDSLNECIKLRDDINGILSSGCFPLRKWMSNDPRVLNGLLNSPDKKLLNLDAHSNNKTLGLLWVPGTDKLHYSISVDNSRKSITKRTILASTAKIFDPLGLLAPVIVISKIILQKLWKSNVTWDESVPNDIYTQWIKYQTELESLKEVEIPRCAVISEAEEIELHGYSDACKTSYGACVYIRSTNKHGENRVHLLCAKSKVAPVKELTIPKLELCGAMLLAQLVSKVIKGTKFKFKCITCWCDSMVVLSWLKTPPTKLKVFVGNRISEINRLLPNVEWQYVNTHENPADLLSRGVMPKTLIHQSMWWNGPKWLCYPRKNWPTETSTYSNTEYSSELRTPATVLVALENPSYQFPIEKFSSFAKLKRCIARCLRFKHNCSHPPQLRLFNSISLEELNNAEIILLKITQNSAFSNEIKDLKKHNKINKKSNLLKLNPFLDKNGILRVGGRLNYSIYAEDKKHPILLPKNNHVTSLVIKEVHFKTLHGGTQLLLATVREKYWPISGRTTCKKVIHECIICFKANPIALYPKMGPLPSQRLTPSAPFNTSGVDYCGPITIKNKRGRGFRTSKAYICIFVCFCTKAIHLELVSELTTEAFIATLHRFISRRGKPSKIFSDNGTNFVGANNELKEFIRVLGRGKGDDNFVNYTAGEEITWEFIPPRSPHFGGLWEAGVKSVKRHLKRIVGDALLTFEDLYTVLTQIEAVVNSRPLCPLSNDANDLNPLTPAHFLIGRTFTTVPEPSYLHLKENRLSIYQRVQQMLQHFWKRWSLEYIGELQKRYKWQQNPDTDINVGTMVLLQMDNTPPSKWPLGRVASVHVGNDQIVRVVTIKTANGLYKRSVTKVCPLPISS